MLQGLFHTVFMRYYVTIVIKECKMFYSYVVGVTESIIELKNHGFIVERIGDDYELFFRLIKCKFGSNLSRTS